VAIPVVLAGAILRRKIFVYESDTVPGLTNKIASKFAEKVFW
jgi:UDP-N-acetylglucosamine:LPS N-acetylglucosamine transferase